MRVSPATVWCRPSASSSAGSAAVAAQSTRSTFGRRAAWSARTALTSAGASEVDQ